MYKRFLLTATLLATSCLAQANPQGVTLYPFLQAVQESNLGLAAQKYNVDVADAAIAVAAIAPDPFLTFGYSSYELSRFILPKGTTVAINYTLESPAKRAARTQVAQADKSLAETQLVEYMTQLSIDAAYAFYDSLRTHAVLERRKKILEIFEQMTREDPAQKKTPLGREEKAQLNIELARLRGEVYQAESDAMIADRNLNFYLGKSALNHPGIFAQGSLELTEVSFDETKLMQTAFAQRPDLVSAEKFIASAQARTHLAQQNRNLDYGLTLAVVHTQPMWSVPDATGVYSPGSYPMSNSMMATVTIPIPLSLLEEDGDLRGPAAAASQAELRLQELHNKAEVEVRQSLLRYQLTVQQVAAYREGVKEAEFIMQDTLQKFSTGAVGFPDIVYYTRTANDIQFAYFEAQAAAAKALLGVYQVSGSFNVAP